MMVYQNLIAGEWVGSDAVENINQSNTDDVIGLYASASADGPPEQSRYAAEFFTTMKTAYTDI